MTQGLVDTKIMMAVALLHHFMVLSKEIKEERMTSSSIELKEKEGNCKWMQQI